MPNTQNGLLLFFMVLACTSGCASVLASADDICAQANRDCNSGCDAGRAASVPQTYYSTQSESKWPRIDMGGDIRGSCFDRCDDNYETCRKRTSALEAAENAGKSAQPPANR